MIVDHNVAFTTDFTWLSLENWRLHSKLLKSMLSFKQEEFGEMGVSFFCAVTKRAVYLLK